MGAGHVGVDVGGTKVLAVRIDATGAVTATATRPMPGRTAPITAVEDAIVAAAHDVSGTETPA
ncbi:hypothetical protein GUY44_14320, partial [Pimelobacter simplex]|nr:hypothetical protein [Pimelobacter simplex]